MALRNIVFSDEPLIRKKCRPVERFDENLWVLLDDLKETMQKNDGVGIAGPQVGVLKRVCIIEACGMFLELINPEIIHKDGKQESEEGCLSVKEYTGLVERPLTITLKAFNRYGSPFVLTVSDFMSIVCCHEIDHLDGILFIDKAKELYKKVDK